MRGRSARGETNPTSEGVEMSRSGLGRIESGEMYIFTGGGTVKSDVQTEKD